MDEQVTHARREPMGWRPSAPEAAEALLVGAPFDGTSGGRPRQAQAPALVRGALGLPEAGGEGPAVWDVGDVRMDPVEPEPGLERLRAVLDEACRRAPSALPVVLGGEHTVSLAAVEALAPATIVSLDAHPDLWDDQHGKAIAQGTWLRRAIEHTGAEAVLLGARAAPASEQAAMDELGVGTELAGELPEPVYLTVDVDVFDPRDAPGVVWPEPEGPEVADVLALVEQIAGEHELAGVDVVEVNAAGPGPTVDLAARVLDRAIGAAGR